MSLKASHSSLPTDDPFTLTDDEAQELRELLDNMLHELSQAAMRLDEEMTRYRQLLSPLVDGAVFCVAPPRPLTFDTHLRRLFYIDAYEAQECMRNCVRHVSLMMDAARFLQDSSRRRGGER